MKQINTNRQQMHYGTYFHLKEFSCSFTIIWCNHRRVNLYKVVILQWFSLIRHFQYNDKMKCITVKRQMKPYPEIRVNGSSGLAANSEQWTEGIRSASQVRKLSDVLQGMVALNLKWKVLKNKNKSVICCLKFCLASSITKDICMLSI